MKADSRRYSRGILGDPDRYSRGIWGRPRFLGRLREVYDFAMIHLFGIKYADEIRECDGSPAEIAELACGGKRSYGTEINKGCALADFVEIRPGVL